MWLTRIIIFAQQRSPSNTWILMIRIYSGIPSYAILLFSACRRLPFREQFFVCLHTQLLILLC